MSSEGEPRGRMLGLLQYPLRDLILVLSALALINILILVPELSYPPLRIPLGFLVVGFIPGYVLTLIIYPEHKTDTHSSAEGTETAPRGLDWIERVTLAIALSIVLATSVTLVLHLSGVGITLLNALIGFDALVVLSLGPAVYRRLSIHASRRPKVEPGPLLDQLHREVASFRGVDRYLLITLVVVLLLVSAGTVYSITTYGPDERYTEFYLLNENEVDGVVASDYEAEFIQGESQQLIVGLESHEHRTVSYTVVVELQRTTERSASATVLEEQELMRLRTTQEHGTEWQRTHNITPSMPGENLRLMYLLYQGEPPDNPSSRNAYREVYLWIDVSNSQASS